VATLKELTVLRRHPDLMPRAVEELLRFVPLGNGSTCARYALEDVCLSGQTVCAGDPVVVEIAAANRDPAVFADPERLDLARSPNPHIAFGHGPHHCLGAQTARLELQVALDTLLRRFPHLRLADDLDTIPWKAGITVRGPSVLRLDW
jgi:cytochrome P450